MNTENHETPRGFSKKPIIIIAAAVIIAGGGAAAAITAVNHANSPAQLITLAQKFLNDADYEKAIIQFDKVLTVDPLNVDAYIGKAEALDALGRSDEAEEVLTKALEMVRDTASPEELEKLRALLDRIKGVVVVQGTQEAAAQPTAEAEPSAEAQPAADGALAQYTLISSESTGDDGSWEKLYYDDQGREVFESQDQYGTIKEIIELDPRTEMATGREYIESTFTEDGTVTDHSISDFFTQPGVHTEYYYSAYNEEEYNESYTYDVDENGFVIRDGDIYIEYEFNDAGFLVKSVSRQLDENGNAKTRKRGNIEYTDYITNHEYSDNGMLASIERYYDDTLFFCRRYDEWGNIVYSLLDDLRDDVDISEYQYDYTFGEDGTPVSAEVTVTNDGQTSHKTETYTYRKNY